MKNIFLFTFFLVLLLVSCGPQENPEQLKEVNQNIERFNSSLIDDNKLLIQSFLDLQKDPQTAGVTGRWLSVVNKIHLHADSLRMMIVNLKSELITQSDSLKREYVTVVKQLYNENGTGGELLKRLINFKDSIPALLGIKSGEDNSYLLKDIPLLPGYRDSLSANDRLQYEMKWVRRSFERSSSLMAMIMLNKIENDLLETEKKLLEYCHSHFCVLAVRYNQYKVLAVLSSSYVKQGQPIEITAGVGGFTDTVKPHITIDDKVIKLNESDCTAVHQFIAHGKPGKHSIVVQIEFTGTDGSLERATKTLNYIIADEK